MNQSPMVLVIGAHEEHDSVVYRRQEDCSFDFLFALLLPAPIIDMIAQRHGLAKPKELCLTVHGSFRPNTSMARLEEQSTPPSVNRPMPHGYMLIGVSVSLVNRRFLNGIRHDAAGRPRQAANADPADHSLSTP